QIPSAGAYSLKVEYFAAVGQAAIQFLWFNAGHSQRMEQSTVVVNVLPRITSDPVRMAITDAEFLLQARGAVSAVDRVHTALHGYLRLICDHADITYKQDDTLVRLLRLLRQQHPVFLSPNPRKHEMEKILNAFGTILDTLNPLRNNATLAHANPSLLSEEEAMLAINAARSILHYLDAKFK
ncbi:MAG: abortive infection family protein, partial [Anaerolineae bacterium]